MGDRHDIDALLIGSLYGELCSADEARLKAHLDSHPADRSALDGLTRARDAVRASRIFEVQLEPPQSVSALLLQEAARRAPRNAVKDEEAREGWFVRLRRSFLFSPAFAAAAMLVVVVGVAGTMYSRKGDHVSRPELSAPALSADEGVRAREPAFATPPAAAPSAAFDGVAATPSAGAAAVAQDPAADRADSKIGAKQEGATRRDQPADSDAYRVDLAEGNVARPAEQQQQQAEKAKARPTAPAALEVTTPRRAPKDLDEPRLEKSAKGFAGPESEEKPARATPAPKPEPAADAPAASAPKRGVAPSPPPPAVRAPDVAPASPTAPSIAQDTAKAPSGATGTAVTGGAGAGAGGSYGDGKGPVDPDLAWAKEQHARLVGQVRAGRCTDAAGTAVSLSNRAPGYYQQNVESDRQVKSCLAYINAERERAAERSQRAKATTRRGGEESTVPAQATKSTPSKAAPPKAAPRKVAPSKAAPAQADEAPASTKSR